MNQEERKCSNEEESTDNTEPRSEIASDVYKVSHQSGPYQSCSSHTEEIRAEKIIHVLLNITVKTRHSVVKLETSQMIWKLWWNDGFPDKNNIQSDFSSKGRPIDNGHQGLSQEGLIKLTEYDVDAIGEMNREQDPQHFSSESVRNNTEEYPADETGESHYTEKIGGVGLSDSKTGGSWRKEGENSKDGNIDQ